MKVILTIVTLLILTACATGNQSSVSKDERGFDVVSKNSKSEQRVALVIGNKDYTSLNPLKNPINDARAMRDILSKKGFNVIYLENASQIEMEDAIDKFGYKIKNGNGVGLFYYAGHGMEVDGVNYLIPIDARIPSKKYVKSKSVSTDIIVTAMEEAKNRMNILILDSCRSNPFGRDGSGGLAPINSAKGVYVAYATAPHKIAQDGEGKNGLFTSYLVKYINKPGLKIEDLFKKVREDVQKDSNGKQIPWSASSIIGDFYFSSSKKEIKDYKIKNKSSFPHKNGITRKDGNCNENDNGCKDGLSFPSFNNYVDTIYRDGTNPYDERKFLQVKNQTRGTTLQNSVSANIGDSVYFESYIHNNGCLNDSNIIAHNVVLKLEGFHHVGNGIYETQANTRINIREYISSSNSIPNSINDDAFVTSVSGKKIKLQYKVGAILRTTRGEILYPNKYFINGQNIGNVKGCIDNSFYTQSTFLVMDGEIPSYDLYVNKTVDGVDSKTANIGDTLDYEIHVKNKKTSKSNAYNIYVFDNYDETKIKIDPLTLPNNNNVSCKDDGKKITCQLKVALAPGGGGHFNYSATIKSNAIGKIINDVKIVSAPNNDTDNSNNRDSAIVKIE